MKHITQKTKIQLLWDALRTVTSALETAQIVAGEPLTAKATEPFRISAILKARATIQLLK